MIYRTSDFSLGDQGCRLLYEAAESSPAALLLRIILRLNHKAAALLRAEPELPHSSGLG